MFVGIISFLPIGEGRQKRLSFIKKQYEWLRSIFKDKTFNIVAMNYEEDDYIRDRNINYIKSQPLKPSSARNILLEKFYSSNEDYMLIMDDDIMLYDYYDANSLLLEIDSEPKKFFMIDMIVGNNPIYLPFKKQNWVDRDNIRKYWKFKQAPFNNGLPLAIIKNIKKHKGISLFFIELEKVKAHEDIDWNFRWAIKGFTRYVCTCWQIKDLGHNFSTIFSKNREEGKGWLENTLKIQPFANKLFKNNKHDYSYIRSFDKTKKIGYIKRDKLFEFTEKEKQK